MKVMSLSLST